MVNANQFQCDICLKILSSKYKLRDHKNKKIPCESSKEFRCQRCKKNFTKKHHLINHLKRKVLCEEKVSDEIILAKEKTKQEEIKIKQEEIKLKQKETDLKKVDKEIKLFKLKAIRDPSIHVDTLNINIQNNVYVPYTTPNGGITVEDVMYILNADDKKEAAERIIRICYLNESIPENRSIACPNISKNDIITFSEDNIWTIEQIDKIRGTFEKMAYKIVSEKCGRMKDLSNVYTDPMDYYKRIAYISDSNSPLTNIELKKLLNENMYIINNIHNDDIKIE
jgi:hypothetical protein